MNKLWKEKQELDRYLRLIRSDYDEDVWNEIQQYCWQLFSKNEITKEELYQLATMLSKKTRRKKSVELSGWEAPEPIKETQSKCWSCVDAENIVPKLLVGRLQLALYFLFEGLLQDSNIPKKINGQSRHRI